ncbi:hypothetical protein WSK_3840 [Novosphingobium sp. Rr 2-17]|nr:hypothetical protein [Novosphingobium sp. Rr 2-17]EIZ77604.1 hypothetical protein WSK_3840 [Novosphingobium sp. Rr 2-17]
MIELIIVRSALLRFTRGPASPAVSAEDIVKRLAAECVIKLPGVGRIGF